MPRNLAQEFKEASEKSYKEICGVLIGQIGDRVANVTIIRNIPNIDDNQYTFTMEPKAFLKAIEDTNLYTDDYSFSFIGIIHSHPQVYAYPSITDWDAARRYSLYVGAYVIYGGLDDTFRAFFWNGDEFIATELKIIETI